MENQPDLLITEKPKEINPKYSYWLQLGFILGFIGVGFIIAAILQLIVGVSLIDKKLPFDKWADAIIKALSKPENVNIMRWLQLVSAFIMFFLPVFFASKIISKKTLPYLGFNNTFTKNQLFSVIGIAFFALILSGVLGELNSIIPIPKKWEVSFKQMEDLYNEQVTVLARMNNFAEYIFVLIVVALAPAIFEEVCFRSGLQQLLVNWTKKPITAIIITSILFSAVHFSYYGFLPRAALGILLGLIFYYSKNIWLSILMHFLNNGISVTALYIFSKNGKPATEIMDAKISTYVGVIAGFFAGIVAVIALIQLYKYFIAESKKLETTDGINFLKTEYNPFA